MLFYGTIVGTGVVYKWCSNIEKNCYQVMFWFISYSIFALSDVLLLPWVDINPHDCAKKKRKEEKTNLIIRKSVNKDLFFEN
jgi:hypothetical protein